MKKLSEAQKIDAAFWSDVQCRMYSPLHEPRPLRSSSIGAPLSSGEGGRQRISRDSCGRIGGRRARFASAARACGTRRSFRCSLRNAGDRQRGADHACRARRRGGLVAGGAQEEQGRSARRACDAGAHRRRAGSRAGRVVVHVDRSAGFAGSFARVRGRTARIAFARGVSVSAGGVLARNVSTR